MSLDSSTSALFSPIRVGNMNLQHRVVLAPLTRLRAHPDHLPSPHAAAYYSQRGSLPGTFLITETAFISQNAGGMDNIPGIYTDAHVEGWRNITDAVHERGSFIYLQLVALGRAAHIDVLLKESNSPFVSASPIPIPGRVEGEVPRALTTDEIKEYIAAYATAAKNAIRAGFDGVEVHGANGCLTDQFIQDVSNNRTDEYGGSIENRARFALEVVDAVVEAIGAERTGIRLSPWNSHQGMGMVDPKPQFSYLVAQLRKHKLAYIHIIEPPTPENNSDFLRDIWGGREGSTFISADGHDRKSAIEIADKKGGLVAFGRLFMPNPDLPFRLSKDLTLASGDPATWYMSGDLTPTGYSDWPFAPENSQQSKFLTSSG